MSYSFLPEAEIEYLEAVRFYEEQQAKLGLSLINEFERVISLVIARPNAWKQILTSGVRSQNDKRLHLGHWHAVE